MYSALILINISSNSRTKLDTLLVFCHPWRYRCQR